MVNTEGAVRTIWIINHYASQLEARHYELACVFARHGYHTVVITSSFHHGKREYLYEETFKAVEKAPGVSFVYLRTGPAYQANGVKRVVNMFDFCRRFGGQQKRIAGMYGRPRYIIGSSLHPLVWELGYNAARAYQAKFIAEFRDIWPLQLTELMGMPKWHPMALFFGWIGKRAYRRADAIVSTMPHADKYICEELGFPREKMHWMPNGLNTDSFESGLLGEGGPISKELEEYLNENWCAVFTGSLVEGECIPFIIEAFAHLSHYPQIRLAIIGDGHSKEKILQTIRAYGLEEQIRIFPHITQKQVAYVIGKSKLCLVGPRKGPLYRYGISVIKLIEYLYSGKPTIIACDYPNVARDAGGISVACDDSKAYADAILRVYNMSPKELNAMAVSERSEIERHYDYARVGKKYLKMMESL